MVKAEENRIVDFLTDTERIGHRQIPLISQWRQNGNNEVEGAAEKI